MKFWKIKKGKRAALLLCAALLLNGCNNSSAEGEEDGNVQTPQQNNITGIEGESNSGNGMQESEDEGTQESENQGTQESENQGTQGSGAENVNTGTGTVQTEITELGLISPQEEDLVDHWSEEDVKNACKVILSGTTAEITGAGAKLEDGDLKISQGGVYLISGELTNGQILVKAGEDAQVHLVFQGVSVDCPDSAAVYVKKTGKVILTLEDGTVNTLTDGETYVYDDVDKEEPSATLFSKCDLTINGGGTLQIRSNFNDAITCKDNLLITNGSFVIESADDGIIGRDSLLVTGGDFTIQAAGDGLKTTNDTEASLGNIIIEGGNFKITAGADTVQAEHAMKISGGIFELETGGGSAAAATKSEGFFGTAAEDETGSAKGIKAGTSLEITSGEFILDCMDDALHTNGSIRISGGMFTIATGDDGVHADSVLEIMGGEMHITKSYEGLEAEKLILFDGKIYVQASDDGVNVAGGNDSSGQAGRFGMDKFSGGTGEMIINGGFLFVDASGDGLDANGSITVNGGTVLVNGPTNGGNGALDYDSSCTINGGILIAAGSTGMVQSASAGTQGCISMTFSSSKEAQTAVSVRNEEGEVLVSFVPSKRYQNVVISIPEFEIGGMYTVLTGGTVSDVSDGLGTVSDAEEVVSFELSEGIVWLDESGVTDGSQGMGGGMGFPGGGRGGDRGGNRMQMPDGGEEMQMPDGSEKMQMPDGSERMQPPDGSEGMQMPDGSEGMQMPDGGEGV